MNLAPYITNVINNEGILIDSQVQLFKKIISDLETQPGLFFSNGDETRLISIKRDTNVESDLSICVTLAHIHENGSIEISDKFYESKILSNESIDAIKVCEEIPLGAFTAILRSAKSRFAKENFGVSI